MAKQRARPKPTKPKPAQPQEQQHAFVGPRLVASVGIMALGSGVGIGLMLAKTLIVVGLALSLLSSLTVIAIYRPHYAKAYKALLTGQRYAGARPLELFGAAALVMILVPLSIVVFNAMRAAARLDLLSSGSRVS